MSLPTNISLIGGTIAGGGPPGGSYSVAAPASITEGIPGTMNVTTSGLANGTTLYWTATPSGEYEASSGSFSINNNAANFTVVATPLTLEGNESGTIEIRTGSISGPIVASDTFNILDDANGTKYDYVIGVGGDYWCGGSSDGGGTYVGFYWYGLLKGSSSGAAITPGDGYTYTPGTLQESVASKESNFYAYQIIRTTA